jgi:hypothetical protein
MKKALSALLIAVTVGLLPAAAANATTTTVATDAAALKAAETKLVSVLGSYAATPAWTAQYNAAEAAVKTAQTALTLALAQAVSINPIGNYAETTIYGSHTFTHTLKIDTYNPKTGAFSGTNTNPAGKITGVLNETTRMVSMTWSYDDSNYVATLTGTIHTSADMSGTGTDNLHQSWTWKAVLAAAPPTSSL